VNLKKKITALDVKHVIDCIAVLIYAGYPFIYWIKHSYLTHMQVWLKMWQLHIGFIIFVIITLIIEGRMNNGK